MSSLQIFAVLSLVFASCSSTPTSGDGGVADLSVVAQPDAGAACQMFCTCMAANCPTETFMSSCLGDCAAGTKWDLPCRMNMCSLVPAQPANDHCTHAMGKFQCLDTP